jgi:hypothetical protein
MANCNKLFDDFNKLITPTNVQMDAMRISRIALEEKIKKQLKEKLGFTPSFLTQGSGASRMKTIIIKSDGTYDADRGVYLPSIPDVEAETVQNYVYEAVKNHTDGGAQHRKKCIRVIYKSAYNIDFPIYYEVDGETYSFLAVKGNGWVKDDPSKMIEWFENLKDENGQLIRIVKCFKAWASECDDFKMPSGIALTVWVARNFIASDSRDDKALSLTLNAIKNAINFSQSCYSPVEPYDDLTSKLTNDQKEKFVSALNEFCIDAEKAIELTNQLQASKLWRKYFGDRFPEGSDEDVDAKAKSLMVTAASVLENNAKLDSLGKINEDSGVSHLTHRNHGT